VKSLDKKNHPNQLCKQFFIFSLLIGLLILNKNGGIQGFTEEISVNSKYTTISGNFLIENTTDNMKIFQIFEVPFIGQTWNVTLYLDNDSTTGITGSATSAWANIWEGPSQFELQGGEIINVQYILHACGDFYDNFILKFHIQLQNSAASAQGAYSAVMHFQGYGLPKECNTGQTYVADITKWLNRGQGSFSDELVLAFLVISSVGMIFFIKKKKKGSEKKVIYRHNIGRTQE
jgi:hypothetical protein